MARLLTGLGALLLLGSAVWPAGSAEAPPTPAEPGLTPAPHTGLECAPSHRTATAPHDSPLPPVQCAGCHDKIRAELGGGGHASARGRAGAPACAPCQR